MKLKIEMVGSEIHKIKGYSIDNYKYRLKSKTSVLDFVIQRQKLSKWCWAAIAASLGNYYRTSYLQQHEVASRMLKFDCSRFHESTSVATHCNQCAMIDEALRISGCYSHWSPGRPTFDRIQSEIDVGQPICLRLEWYKGGFHYLVLIGYYNETGEIYVDDPLHGSSVQVFENFPSSYRGTGGIWRETFWTCSHEQLNE